MSLESIETESHDSFKGVNPRNIMHSVLLKQVNRNELEIYDRSSTPHFEVAAWLNLKNIQQLPSMLLIEYTDKDRTGWQVIDTSRMHSTEGTILLSGVIDLAVRKLMSLDIYFCHPSGAISCELEELLVNNKPLKQRDEYLYNVA